MEVMIKDEKMMANVTANITAMLETRDWSLRELSRRSGVHVTTLSQLLNGRVIPSVVVMAKIAAALETQVDYLLQRHEKKTVGAA
jgi:transcriptional regulator with XRE-family HTH domain